MMTREIRWTRSLSARLGAVTVLLLGASIALVSANAVLLSGMRGDALKQKLFGKGTTYAYQLLADAWKLASETGDARARTAAEMREILAANQHRYEMLLNGDPAAGVPAVVDPQVRAGLRERSEAWRAQFTPEVERLIAAPPGDAFRSQLAGLETSLDRYAESTSLGADDEQRVLVTKVERVLYLQYLFGALVLVVTAAVIWIARDVSGRARSLASVADRIASGELGLIAPTAGADELATLGEAFNAMTGSLRRTIEAEKDGRARLERLFETIAEIVSSLASASAEILAGTTQQASGAQEQAAAVAETVTTVDEVAQTADQAAQRARAVAEAAQRSVEVGKAGRKAVDESVASMATVKEQTETVAESILALAERAQAIAEIIAAVNDIAEQTNLLALNAGIEASRAGEHGKGFSVVATEVKALADQSKKATAQVRQILGEIQRATNSAVMSAEEATKIVNGAIKVVAQAGDTIKALADILNEAAQAAAQITASAGQQSAGMAQIHQAMRNINQATTQSLASTQQAERSIQDLNTLGQKLKELVVR
jgi:methyl-accepting chemotaxis protein